MKIFITLENVLIDSYGILRPGTHAFISELIDAEFQVYLWSSYGMEYVRRTAEKHEFPSVHGYMVRGGIDRIGVDYVVDADPVFMVKYPGICVKEYNSMAYDLRDIDYLSNIFKKILADVKKERL